ncbi:MAG: ATP-binding protein [Thermoleophilia bacterium]
MRSALRIPADLRAVAFVRCALACLLERERWPAEGSGRVLLAVTEAVTNAIEHGSGDGAAVEVALEVTAGRVLITVVDEGVPGIPVPALPRTPPPDTALSGRGLLIIRRLADDLVLTGDGAGTRIDMGFLRATAEAAQARLTQRERRAA